MISVSLHPNQTASKQGGTIQMSIQYCPPSAEEQTWTHNHKIDHTEQ